MKKLILILTLSLVIAACAVEPQVVVVTSTPVPPTVTPAPPTVTPIPPTITPEAWDATVSALSTGLRQLPYILSQVIATLPGGTTVDLLAITEDKEWVQVTAYLEGVSEIEGWLQVDKLRLNVSLDDLEVDTETALVLPPTHTPGPTRTPGPTEVSQGDRYINHFLERGFKYNPDREQYLKEARWGELMIDVNEGERYIFGYFEFEPMTSEDAQEVLDHLEEASNFLDPGNGWDTVQAALAAISNGQYMGTAENSQGRDLFFEARPFDNDPPTWLMLFTYSDAE